MADCHDLFIAFHEKIVLPSTAKKKLLTARDAIREKIKKHFQEAGRKPTPAFQEQGSYVMDTLVIPYDGEFDIDDGVYLQHLSKESNTGWPTPETAHKWVNDAVDRHTNENPIDKGTCVRVRYTGKYHVDLPIYACIKGDTMLAEKGDKGWHRSEPQAITEWFKKASSENGDQLVKMVRYFKAWADNKSKYGKLPSGLVFSILVVENFMSRNRDDTCFGRLASKLYQRMYSNSVVMNPVDSSEDLLQRYGDEIKERFVDWLRSLKEIADEALYTDDKQFACRKWLREFGERWSDCKEINDEEIALRTTAPAILKDDARSA